MPYIDFGRKKKKFRILRPDVQEDTNYYYHNYSRNALYNTGVYVWRQYESIQYVTSLVKMFLPAAVGTLDTCTSIRR